VNRQGSIYFDREKNRYIVTVTDSSQTVRWRKRIFYTKKRIYFSAWVHLEL